MRKIIFSGDGPSGKILIPLKESSIWIDYVANNTFNYNDGTYENFISSIENNPYNINKILVIVNDNSEHGYYKRCYIKCFSDDELKNI